MPAILFGSISTVADTSELQRQAFNQAFATHGLDWQWDREEYRALLTGSGGQDRIAAYAADRGETVDAAAVHQTKSQLFCESLAEADLAPRSGVVETIRTAKENAWKVGLVTTTSSENVTALLASLDDSVSAQDFDVIVDSSQVERPKPDAEAYTFATMSLGEQPDDCVAIEDNEGGVAAASAAGITVVAFPNENTAGHDFGSADRHVESLDADELGRLATSA